MFQFTWFDKSAYNNNAIKIEKTDIPKDFISLDKIERIRTLYWDEHCLECSPPDCYGNCNYWQRRKDGSCVRFYYGIKRTTYRKKCEILCVSKWTLYQGYEKNGEKSRI